MRVIGNIKQVVNEIQCSLHKQSIQRFEDTKYSSYTWEVGLKL